MMKIFIYNISLSINMVLKGIKYFLLIFIVLFTGVFYLYATNNITENNNAKFDLANESLENQNLRGINIYISESVYHLTYSEECILNINIDGFDASQILRGFEIEIKYDTDFLTSTSGDIQEGTFLSYFANNEGTLFLINGQDGDWFISDAFLGTPKKNHSLKDKPTSGTLFSIKLTALSNPSCYTPILVTLSNIVLRNELNNPIEFDSVSGAEIYINPTLIIPLKMGWNLISSWIVPESMALNDIFAELKNDDYIVKIQDEVGNYYVKDIYGEWQNTIGSYNMEEGYYVLVNNDCELSIKGNGIELPITINLVTGWNIIPYLYHNSQDAQSFISPLIDSNVLIKVQDETGHTIVKNIYDQWINDIGLFKEGEAYYVLISEPCQFTYPIFISNKKENILK